MEPPVWQPNSVEGTAQREAPAETWGDGWGCAHALSRMGSDAAAVWSAAGYQKMNVVTADPAGVNP